MLAADLVGKLAILITLIGVVLVIIAAGWWGWDDPDRKGR